MLRSVVFKSNIALLDYDPITLFAMHAVRVLNFDFNTAVTDNKTNFWAIIFMFIHLGAGIVAFSPSFYVYV